MAKLIEKYHPQEDPSLNVTDQKLQKLRGWLNMQTGLSDIFFFFASFSSEHLIFCRVNEKLEETIFQTGWKSVVLLPKQNRQRISRLYSLSIHCRSCSKFRHSI